jgi:transcriptional regulator with XRE-family HTH domain
MREGVSFTILNKYAMSYCLLNGGRTVLGDRIRELRTNQKLSMSELARRAQVSKGMLSQVERNAANPSVETVRQIAMALEVPLFTLFVEGNTPDGVVRKADRRRLRVPGSDIEREILSPDLNRRMVLVRAVFHPGDRGTREPLTHRGEECILVLTGQLTVRLGDDPVVLGSGDTIHFDGSVPHLLVNESAEDADVLVVISPPQV